MLSLSIFSQTYSRLIRACLECSKWINAKLSLTKGAKRWNCSKFSCIIFIDGEIRVSTRSNDDRKKKGGTIRYRYVVVTVIVDTWRDDPRIRGYVYSWSRWPRVEEYTFEYRKMWHRATTLNTSKRGFSTLNINFPLPEHTPWTRDTVDKAAT